jgi:hypothetical protein
VLLVLTATAAFLVSMLFGPVGAARAASSLRCEIHASAGAPCVVAHSAVRALLAAYNGPLYQVKRASDGATTNIGLPDVGDYANASTRDAFFSGTSCVITEIHDQVSKHNNLAITGPGGNGAQYAGAKTAALPLTGGGHKVYGLYATAGVRCRNSATSGVPTGSQPQDAYMVASGTHTAGNACSTTAARRRAATTSEAVT